MNGELGTVGAALRKLAEAASSHLGRDCYTHAAIGQHLLADRGIEGNVCAGFAAWRVGPSNGAVVAHVPLATINVCGGMGFPYHAWLTVGEQLVDFTTYQLRRKARDLDAADGGCTEVEWCPDMLIVDASQVATYAQVAHGITGSVYYERIAKVETLLAATFSLDPADLEVARFIAANPQVNVLGPGRLAPRE